MRKNLLLSPENRMAQLLRSINKIKNGSTMALLPIIYLSVLITAALAITVILFSFISSKLRNKGNGDRILALSYAGTTSPAKPAKEQVVAIQRKETHRRTLPKSDREIYAEVKKRQKTDDRFTKVTTEKEQFEARTRANNSERYNPETRTSFQKPQKRLEVITNTDLNTTNYSGGEARKSTVQASDPLYFYSASNDQNFYTIKAS